MLLCLRPHRGSELLVRAAYHMAERLRAEWFVAYVECPAQRPLGGAEREALVSALNLAERLGAQTAVLSGDSVSDALVAFANARLVSRIVVGKPAHARWRDRLRGSLLDDLVRRSGDIDVYFISGERAEASRPAPRPVRPSMARSHLEAAGVVVLATALCRVLFGRFDNANLIMVYLLGVAFVATRYGRGPSAVAALLSVAAFDFFFVPPHLTFAVADTQYAVTFAVMLVVGLLISTLAVQVREQAEATSQRERRTQVLYALSRELAGLRAPDQVADVVCRHLAELFRGPAVVLLANRNGEMPRSDLADAMVVPLRSGDTTIGAVGVKPADHLRPLAPEQVDLLETIAHQAAAALERARLAAEGEEARMAMERERLRSALLSSVSHDLRTPLAAIEGAASTLLDESAALERETRRDLLETIHEEAQRLHRRVRDLLDMTRLESGSVTLDVEWQSLEEIVGSALNRAGRVLGERGVSIDLPPSLPLVPCDAVLLEQVLVNLLENASKYSGPGGPIEVMAREAPREVVLTVADHGPGIAAGEEEHIFEKFYRSSSSRGADGVGLGLAICRAIVTAHGGRIWALNREGGGAAFHVSLPRRDPPSPPTEPSPDETHRAGTSA